MPDHSTRPLTKNNTESAGTTVRVFFAIWPDNAAQEQMAGLTKRLRLASLCNGRETKAENIHLTLAFLGEVEPHGLEALRVVANGMGTPGSALLILLLKKFATGNANVSFMPRRRAFHVNFSIL